MSKKIIAVAMFSLLALVLAGCSKGNPKNQAPDQEKNSAQGLPSESLSACQEKSEGDSCEAAMPQRDNSGNKTAGICKKAPGSDQLSCMPQGGPGGGQPSGPGGQKPFDTAK